MLSRCLHLLLVESILITLGQHHACRANTHTQCLRLIGRIETASFWTARGRKHPFRIVEVWRIQCIVQVNMVFKTSARSELNSCPITFTDVYLPRSLHCANAINTKYRTENHRYLYLFLLEYLRVPMTRINIDMRGRSARQEDVCTNR